MSVSQKEFVYAVTDEIFTGTVFPIFRQMEMVDLANAIGIDPLELEDAIKKRNSFIKGLTKNFRTKDLDERIIGLMKEVDLKIENEEFKRKLFSKILFMKDYGKVKYNDDSLIGYYKNNDKKYCFEMTLKDNNINYTLKEGKNNKVLVGNYNKNVNGESTIDYYEQDVIISNLKDKIVEDITTIQKQFGYDKNGYQMRADEYRQFQKRDVDKNSGEKIVRDFEIETSIKLREGEYIVRKVEKRDEVQEIFSDGYLIAKNLTPEAKDLPKGGNFEQVSKEMYTKYINGECTIEELWENRNKTFYADFGRSR